MKSAEYKIRELKPVAKEKVGRVIDRGGDRESHEYQTVVHLAGLGFDVELLRASNIPHSNNPDIEMAGTVWEMKAPESVQENTNSSMFRKAVKQSGGRAVFDLRRVKGDADEAERNFMKLFTGTRGMRRMIIIKKTGQTIDIVKRK